MLKPLFTVTVTFLLLIAPGCPTADLGRLTAPFTADHAGDHRAAGPADRPLPAVPLAELGIRFRPAPVAPVILANGVRCGMPDGVRIVRGATGIRYRKTPHVNEAFAARLARFETIVQREALQIFGRRVVAIEQYGTYVCRGIRRSTMPSEHATGNAIDVAAFVLARGGKIVVKRDYVRSGAEPTTPSGLFLTRVTQRLAEESIFGAILTPDFDEAHHNHLHLDGRRRFWFPLAAHETNDTKSSTLPACHRFQDCASSDRRSTATGFLQPAPTRRMKSSRRWTVSSGATATTSTTATRSG